MPVRQLAVNADPPLQSLVAVVDADVQEPLALVPTPLGTGADASVYSVRGHPDFVVKLYHDPEADPNRQAKLEAMLRAVPDRCVSVVHGERVVELAWPETLVASPTKDGRSQTLGFVMPAVDLDAAVLMVELLSPRARRAAGISDDVRFRVTAAANLAASVAALHAEGHHVIDLKPSNLHVYRSSALIAILDCDGMSIQAPDGSRFPAHQYTDGTIAPEALQSQARPEDLGEAQDRFALATVIFQLLNNGLHPFQGVPTRGAAAPTTNGERIAAGLYPYGSGSHTLTPPPASPYPFLDSRTQTLFTRAFDSSPDARPSAREWRDHLRELLTSTLSPCTERSDHARFGDKLCATCELDPVLRKKRSRAAFAARRHATYPDDPDEVAAYERVNGMMYVIPIVFFGIIFIGWATGIVLKSWVSPISEPYPPVSLAEAIRSYGFRDVLHAFEETPDRAITANNEATFPWPYGPGFDITQAWNADHQLDPLPESGLPPLHQAAFDAKPYVLGLLLTRDVDVNEPDASSRTPLMYSASSRIAPNAMNMETAIELAARVQRTGAVYQGRSESEIASAFTYELYPLDLNDLPIHSVTTHANGVDYGSYLVARTLAHRSLTVHHLIDAGADVNAQDRWGRTPLAYAALSGNGAALWQLLNAGADPNLADAAGVTPLMIVADQVVNLPTDSLGVELASLLLVGGADASQTDRSERIAAEFVSSPQAIYSDPAALVSSLTLSVLEAAAQPDWSRDVAWLRTAEPPFSGRQPDAENAADIGDWKTDSSTAESDALAATLPAPPWNSTLQVVCSDIEPVRIEAQLELRQTPIYGVAEPAALLAPDWIGTDAISAEERTETPDLREQRALDIRARERCLARAKLTLSRRFDVRGVEQSTGPIWVEMGRAGE